MSGVGGMPEGAKRHGVLLTEFLNTDGSFKTPSFKAPAHEERIPAEERGSSERMVLSAMISTTGDPARVREAIERLSVADFVGARNQILFGAAKRLSDRGIRPIPAEMVSELVRTDPHGLGLEYLPVVDGDGADPEAVLRYAGEVKTSAMHRAVEAAAAAGAPPATLIRLISAAETTELAEEIRPTVEDRPVLADEDFYGVLGGMVGHYAPSTEADPVGIYAVLISLAGAAIGRGAFTQLGAAAMQHTRIWPVLAGDSAEGRKGTAGADAAKLMRLAGEECQTRTTTGLSSGEGVVSMLRDPVQRNGLVVDEGVADKCVVVVEPELARTLKVGSRQGGSLIQTLRQAWDGDDLAVMTKNSPLTATAPHLVLVAHVTPGEFVAQLDPSDITGGFVNRLLLVYVHRSQLLPKAPPVPWEPLEALGRRLREGILFGRSAGLIEMDDDAEACWDAMYRGPLQVPKIGAYKDATARAPAQVIRLALVFAVLDLSYQIRAEHLRAGWALWNYADATAKALFGKTTGDPVADDILRVIEESGASGITRTELAEALGKHLASAKMTVAINALHSAGRISVVKVTKAVGRPTHRYFAKGVRKAAA